MEEVLDQVEHAVAAPDLLPQVRGGEIRGARLVPGAAVLAAVEWKKPGLRPFQLGRDVDQVWVDGEVTEAPAELKERFLRVAVVLVLPTASRTVWPVNGFFNSEVKIGSPFRNRDMSRLFSFLSL